MTILNALPFEPPPDYKLTPAGRKQLKQEVADFERVS